MRIVQIHTISLALDEFLRVLQENPQFVSSKRQFIAEEQRKLKENEKILS